MVRKSMGCISIVCSNIELIYQTSMKEKGKKEDTNEVHRCWWGKSNILIPWCWFLCKC